MQTSKHPLLFDHASQAGCLFCASMLGTVAFLAALACPGPAAWAQTGGRRTDLAVRPEFREPVILTSKEGVLEVRLIARQGHATLDTVAKPVQNFLLFDYEVIRGSGRTLQIISASYIKPAITNFRFFI